MDSLIQHASVVVSTSLYEAGNGPGIDAWVRGVPVAMSNIPAFMEHLEVQGVKAEVFDPLNPEDIALKIENILTNPEKTKNEALESKQALSRITWEETARSYVKAFEKAINEYRTLG
jgi:glycosyltransferase involved in cell wall biosynthesis